MPVFALTIALQLACAVHCVRNGRNSMWLMLIIFLPVLGSLAYAWFEILPQYAGRREVRMVKAAAVRKLDPDRAVRAAREALSLADTAANHDALADALADQGSWGDAVRHYREALARGPSGDRVGQLKLGRALLESGQSREARKVLEALPQSGSPSENDRAGLLLARALDELGDYEPALALYADLARRLPGAEAHCRQAALLIKLGRLREAEPILVEVERLAKRLDRMQRAADADMYDWAKRTLAELRGGQAT